MPILSNSNKMETESDETETKSYETETKSDETKTKSDEAKQNQKTDIAIWQHKQKVMKRSKKQ